MSGPIVPPLEVTEVDGSPDGRPITKLIVSSGDLTISGRTATIDTTGSGAPDSAEYLLGFDASIPASLTAARILTNGGNISFSHGAGANDDMVIAAVAAGAANQIQYNSGVSNFFTAIAEFDYNPATGSLGVGTTTTNGGAVVTIAADGTGKPVLDLTNASKSASLEVTTNQELTIKGGTDTFKFDVSSATGGITWPDGTSQITAASGGGGGGISSVLPLIGSTGADQYNIGTAMPWGNSSNSTQAIIGLGGQPHAFPFIAPETGTVDEIGVRVTTGDAGMSLYVAIYSNDSNNLPSSLLGYATIPLDATGDIYDSSLSASVSLTAGTAYWYTLHGDQVMYNGVIKSNTLVYLPDLGITDGLSNQTYSLKDAATTQYAVPPATLTPDTLNTTITRPYVGIKYA